MKDNITLIGMPASGKSTIGVMLAKYMGKNFLDTDIYIQNLMGDSLSNLIKQKGLVEFCKIEDQTISSIMVKNTLIATGGSVVYGVNAMKNLKLFGTIVYLYSDFEPIKQRISSLEKRGVVHRPDQSLKDLYEERKLLYENWTDYTIDTNGKTPEAVAFEIMDIFP